MKIHELLKNIEKYNLAKDMIETFNIKDTLIKNDYSKQGFIYERLWDICIKFGLVKNIINFNTKNKLKHITGNINNEIENLTEKQFKEINKFFDTYLNDNIISGNSGGYSDITFKNNESVVISSSKYYNNAQNKNINDYDIEKLCIILDKYNKNNLSDECKIKIILFLKNKNEFISKIANSNKSSLITLKYINPNGNYENVYDLNDLEIHYEELKRLLSIYNYLKTGKDISDFKKEYLKNLKKLFKPRFHQQLFIKQSYDIINSKNENKNILIGAVPRSGKTFIMAGIILEYIKNNKIKKGCNFIIITPVPTETISQYEDVFNSYLDFDKYNIKTHAITEKKNKISDIIKNKDNFKDTNNIFLISIQKLNKNTDININKDTDKDTKKLTDYSKKEIKDIIKDINPNYIIKSNLTKAELIEIVEIVKNPILHLKPQTLLNKTKDEIKNIIKDINPNYKFKSNLTKAELIKIAEQSPIDIKNQVIIKKKKGGYKSSINDDFTNFLKSIDFKIIFIDEAHYVMSSTKSRDLIINSIEKKYNNRWKIFVTATYNKPIKKYNIQNKIFWNIKNIITLQRISNIKDNNKLKLKKFNNFYNEELKLRFKEDIINSVLDNDYNIKINKLNSIVNINNINKILKQYNNFPEPFLLTTIWNNVDTIYKEIKKAEDTNYSFDMNRLFSLNKTNSNFENKEQIVELFHYYFGYPRKDITYKQQKFYKYSGIIPRIQRICNNNCRTMQNIHKITQLWFLPYGTGQKILFVIESLLKILEENFNYLFKKTLFLVAISGDIKNKKNNENIFYNNDINIKEEIEKIESILNEKLSNYDNFIILTGARLQLGVSLPNVDIVVLFNSIKSVDVLYQSMFRSMTEVENDKECNSNEYCPKKKYGFIVDLNPQRTLTITDYIIDDILYDEKDNGESNTIINKRKLITDLFNIDRDFFKIRLDDDNDDNEKEKDEELIKYTNELFNKLSINYNENVDNIINEIDKLNIDFDYKILDDEIINIINKYIKKINKQEYKNENNINELDDKSKYVVTEDINIKKSKDDIKKEQLLNEKIKKLLGELINIISIITANTELDINIFCIFDKQKTIDNIKTDLLYLLNKIKENEELKDIFIHIIKNRCNIDIENDDLFFQIFEKILKSIIDRNE
jgi:hypothetical protein